MHPPSFFALSSTRSPPLAASTSILAYDCPAYLEQREGEGGEGVDECPAYSSGIFVEGKGENEEENGGSCSRRNQEYGEDTRNGREKGEREMGGHDERERDGESFPFARMGGEVIDAWDGREGGRERDGDVLRRWLISHPLSQEGTGGTARFKSHRTYIH
jgi:hypothetical protein